MINITSLFSRNMGQLDQGLRALAGTTMTWLAWFERNDQWMIIGVIVLLTSVLRFCPTYFVLRFNTLRRVKSREAFSWDEFLDRNALPAAVPADEEPKPVANEENVPLTGGGKKYKRGSKKASKKGSKMTGGAPKKTSKKSSKVS
jgi:hypothetical protein